MTSRVPATVLIGSVAVLAVLVIAAAIAWRASGATIAAGFWWEDAPFLLSVDDTAKIGGALSAGDLTRIKDLSRGEVERAYSGLRINVTNDRTAFWHVGESRIFGPLGGAGSVAVMILAHNAIEYAAAGASRAQIVDGIGRGIGRAAVHELAHQVLGLDNVGYIDNRTDENSYEYGNADRPAQYYGDLRWTTARPVLQSKFGR